MTQEYPGDHLSSHLNAEKALFVFGWSFWNNQEEELFEHLGLSSTQHIVGICGGRGSGRERKGWDGRAHGVAQ